MSQAHEAAEQVQPAVILEPGDPTPWTGFIDLGGTLMIIAGVAQMIGGLGALLDNDYYAVPDDQLAIAIDYTAWGWIHLLLGVVVVLSGVGVFLGRRWAAAVAVVLAVVSALTHMAFLKAYPFGSAIIITFDILVIYALVAHRREVTADSVEAGPRRPGRPETPFIRLG